MQGSIGGAFVRTKYSAFIPVKGGPAFGTMGSNLFVFEPGLGFSTKIAGTDVVSRFTFGEGTRVFTARGVSGRIGFTPQRFRFKPEGFGVEFDLNKAFGASEEVSETGIKVLTGGGKKTPFSVTFQDQQLISQLSTLKQPSIIKQPSKGLSKQVFTTPPIETGIVGIKQQSAFWGTGQYERTEGGLFPGQQLGFVKTKQINKIDVDTTTNVGIGFGTSSNISPVLGLREELKTETILLPRIRSKIDVAEIQQPRTSQRLGSGIKQKFDFEFKPRFIGDPISRIKRPGLRTSFRSGFGFGIPGLPSLDLGGGKKGRGKGDREFFRQPSFAAAQLGITAIEPGPLEFTGLVERPLLIKKKKKRKSKGGLI